MPFGMGRRFSLRQLGGEWKHPVFCSVLHKGKTRAAEQAAAKPAGSDLKVSLKGLKWAIAGGSTRPPAGTGTQPCFISSSLPANSIPAIPAVPLRGHVPRDETSPASAGARESREPGSRQLGQPLAPARWTYIREFLFNSQQTGEFRAGKKQGPDLCHGAREPLRIPGQAGVSDGFVLSALSPKFRGPSGHPTSKYNSLYDDAKSGKYSSFIMTFPQFICFPTDTGPVS